MKGERRFKFFIVALLFVVSLAKPTVVFRIGKVDGSYKEFALSGNYSLYLQTFPQDVIFKVGESKEARDFPYIHPGPSDFWAGARPHTFRIIFSLDHQPQATSRLTLHLVNTHYGSPPRLSLSINSHPLPSVVTPAGGGDASLYDPAQGKRWTLSFVFPSSLLRQGENEISITNQQGSWLLYDAITLEEGLELEGPIVTDIRATCSPFFLREGSSPKQVLQIYLNNAGGEGDIEIALKSPKVSKREKQRIASGMNEISLPLPDELKNGERLEVEAQGARCEVEVKRYRKFLLFLAPSVHTDIGYTDVQDRVVQRHNQNIKIAIEECERNPAFKWNLEVAWQVENFLRDEPTLKERLLQLLRENRFSLQALYGNMLTGLCSPESLLRVPLYAKRLADIYRFLLDSALLTDVPSAIYTLPSLLHSFGVKYLAEAINTYRARFPYPSHPFYWEGPDGGKVLFFPSPGYAWAQGIGLLDSLEAVGNRIHSLVEDLERNGYPYDTYLLYGAFSDNAPLDPRFMQLVEEWNAKYAYPRIIVALNDEFFRYMEQKYKDKIPTYRLDAGAYWEDGAVSTAKELAMNRQAKDWAVEGEILFSLSQMLNPSLSYPREEFQKLWRDILLFDEHTWGAWCSVSDPFAETTLRQWEIKASFAHSAYQRAERLREEGFRHFASLIDVKESSILIFNSLSFPRSDIVKVKVPYEDFRLYDGKREIPWQREGDEVVFYIKDVPSLGYKTIRIEQGKASSFPSPFSISSSALESPFFRITFNEEGIISLYDKESKQELLKKGEKLGDYLYIAGPPDNPVLHKLGRGKVWVENNGPVFCDLCFLSSGYKTPKYLLRLRLYKDINRIDITIEMDKEETLDKEMVFISFPFALEKPEVRLEYPGAITEPLKEQFPHACKNWFTIHKWASLGDKRKGILWVSQDAPLLSLGQPFYKEWQDELRLADGSLFSFIMHNHWDTNYKASQGGSFTFRYSIFPFRSNPSNTEATQLAWSTAHPLLALHLSPQKGALSGEGSFLGAEGAIVTTLKGAEDGKGWVLRLWRAERKGGKVRVRTSLPLREAFLCNPSESPQEKVSLKEALSSPPSAFLTLRLR